MLHVTVSPHRVSRILVFQFASFENKFASLSRLLSRFGRFVRTEDVAEQRANANNGRSLSMGRSSPYTAKRLIPNAGCANGANDHRIRHVSIIKQLGPGSFFLSLQCGKCGEQCGEQRMTCALALTLLRYPRSMTNKACKIALQGRKRFKRCSVIR